MKNRNWTDEQLKEAIKTSNTIAEVLRKLGLLPQGSNYITVKKAIKNIGIDTSHFLGKAHLKGMKRSLTYKVATSAILIENSPVGTSTVKSRIIKDKLIPYKCCICKLVEWENKPLVLHLDHKNGINNDHRIDNLRFLCPNCHSQTDTYCGKNAKHILNCKVVITQKNFCIDCDAEILLGSSRCLSCSAYHKNTTKICWPPTQELIKMVKELGHLGCGKKLGVTDNSVRKRIINHPND